MPDRLTISDMYDVGLACRALTVLYHFWILYHWRWHNFSCKRGCDNRLNKWFCRIDYK